MAIKPSCILYPNRSPIVVQLCLRSWRGLWGKYYCTLFLFWCGVYKYCCSNVGSMGQSGAKTKYGSAKFARIVLLEQKRIELHMHTFNIFSETGFKFRHHQKWPLYKKPPKWPTWLLIWSSENWPYNMLPWLHINKLPVRQYKESPEWNTCVNNNNNSSTIVN